MKVKGKYKFEASQKEVWDLFMNPDTLIKAIPGCEKLEENGPGSYDAVMKIGIAAVKGTYEGKFAITDQEPFSSYRLLAEGSGSPGFVKGGAVIELSDLGNGKTLVKYNGETEVGGLIAGVGQRMISGVSKMMADKFFKSMAKELKIQKGEYQPGVFEKMWKGIKKPTEQSS